MNHDVRRLRGLAGRHICRQGDCVSYVTLASYHNHRLPSSNCSAEPLTVRHISRTIWDPALNLHTKYETSKRAYQLGFRQYQASCK